MRHSRDKAELGPSKVRLIKSANFPYVPRNTNSLPCLPNVTPRLYNRGDPSKWLLHASPTPACTTQTKASSLLHENRRHALTDTFQTCNRMVLNAETPRGRFKTQTPHCTTANAFCVNHSRGQDPPAAHRTRPLPPSRRRSRSTHHTHHRNSPLRYSTQGPTVRFTYGFLISQLGVRTYFNHTTR